MNKFKEYYSKEIIKYGGYKNYISAKAREKKILIELVKKFSPNKKVLEAGCGSGTNSVFLSNKGFNVVCVDNDSEMVSFAKELTKRLRFKPTFVKKDLFDLSDSFGNFDVSFSHGVLEHYSDEDIIKLINAQLSTSRFVIFSVPSDFFKQEDAINGDERFLSERKWRKILSGTNGEIIVSFSYYYDSKELRVILRKLISYITFDRLKIKKPYLGFVIKKCT